MSFKSNQPVMCVRDLSSNLPHLKVQTFPKLHEELIVGRVGPSGVLFFSKYANPFGTGEIGYWDPSAFAPMDQVDKEIFDLMGSLAGRAN